VSGKRRAAPDIEDDAPLQAFEARIWSITGRKLSAREIDLILIEHERYVNRAVNAHHDDHPPDRRKQPRRVVGWSGPETPPQAPAAPYEVEFDW
jgi:hypothetical protein